MNGGRHRRLRAAAGICALMLVCSAAAQPQATPPAPSFSPHAPDDVRIPAGFNDNPIAFFDDYSWRAFIAMVWPASDPGAPNVGANLTDPGARVFEGFRSNWDTFLPGGAPPPPWNEAASSSPCNNAPIPRNDVLIADYTKFGELAQAGVGELLGPLVAQNGTYVRYLTGFNRLQYEHIVANGMYLRANLPGPRSPDGAIAVKSSWIEMTGVAHPERFHTRLAWINEPDTGACVERMLGLVGLHIVVKTPSRPQWIWATFEHIDTVPGSGADPDHLVFHDGGATPMPATDPNIGFPPPTTPPLPFNVERLTPINPSTADTNLRWRAALAQQSSVWSFYQLVMTQWPIQPNRPRDNGGSANTFPGEDDASSAFANVTMETFHQTDIESGCMVCHNSARRRADFIWSVATHAFPLPSSNVPSGLALFARDDDERSLMRLRAALERGRESQAETVRERARRQ